MAISKLDIKQILYNNDVFVNDINQLMHNEGIIMNDRMDIIINLLNNYLYNSKIPDEIPKKIATEILSILKTITIDKNEIAQILFMFYCNKKTKINLDQFYTPFTIGKFMCSLMIPGKKVIDPACGTGDLVKHYKGDITLWDVNNDVLNICKDNYKLNQKKCNIRCMNSIINHNVDNNQYDYCCLNPPFGSSTTIKDNEILKHFQLGKNKKKQEIGILFIERTMNLLKNNGIAFIIVPNGYLGNSAKNMIEFKKYIETFKILSLIELPANTFSRSGTGVSVSIIIIQKSKPTNTDKIFIKKLENIGYVLNKKNTPYKYKTNNGNIVVKNDKPVLDNDLNECYQELVKFVKDEKINNIYCENVDENGDVDENDDYEFVVKNQIHKHILDISRYLNIYKNVIEYGKANNFKKIKEYVIDKPKTKFTIQKDNQYLYLDIKQITTPIYKKSNILYGHELPGRAKINVKKNDLIVSRLKGNLSFTVILQDDTNIICSNGFSLLRPKNYESMLILFANLFEKGFKIQHNSLCTGSIMASLADNDIKNIIINPVIDKDKFENIINALKVINTI